MAATARTHQLDALRSILALLLLLSCVV